MITSQVNLLKPNFTLFNLPSALDHGRLKQNSLGHHRLLKIKIFGRQIKNINFITCERMKVFKLYSGLTDDSITNELLYIKKSLWCLWLPSLQISSTKKKSLSYQPNHSLFKKESPICRKRFQSSCPSSVQSRAPVDQRCLKIQEPNYLFDHIGDHFSSHVELCNVKYTVTYSTRGKLV